MFYIKLDDDRNLVITMIESLYRGDNLHQKITYLLPLKIGEIETQSAYVYLNYIRADGIPDVVTLEQLDEKYNESYYQYTVPVTCRLTKYPGEVCTWLTVYSGSPSDPQIAKSGECVLQIQESKNIDDYICDHQLTAIYKLQKELDENKQDISGEFEKIAEDIAKKADGMTYDEDTRKLQLKSGEKDVSDPVIIPSDDYSATPLSWGEF